MACEGLATAVGGDVGREQSLHSRFGSVVVSRPVRESRQKFKHV